MRIGAKWATATAIAIVFAHACSGSSPSAEEQRPAALAPAATAPAVTLETQGGKKLTVTVEIARTPKERAVGLMNRPQMAEDHGMLFVMGSRDQHSFWMKNTLIPLDMLFLEADGTIVGIVESAEPKTLTPRQVDRPSEYVLELVGGYCKKHGVVPGDRVDFAKALAWKG
jgi:hypothetical protein